jgi:YrbI family 3-deoxy-D-manno-octulosonate 8-phosphate phosphatase
MVVKPEVLAIIPARGGSKGIPRKNIRDFAGFPLIAWSIAAAKQSKYVTRTVISTDDEEIAAVARQLGAEAPFLRPAEFAQDNTTDLPVFKHALDWLQEHEGYRPDIVIQLRPTSPIRPRTCVDDAIQILIDHPDADSVRGIVDSGQNPFKMWKVDTGTGKMIPLLTMEGIKEPYNAPRQQLPKTYWQTGHIDAIRPRAILEKGSMSGDTIMPLHVDARFTVDIDNPSDWIKYERLVKEGGLDMVTPGPGKRPFPAKVELLVMDFDGVLTDNRVWVDEEGHELVASNRSDSLGLLYLREKTAVKALVLSKEVNPVVSARCRKIKLECVQAVNDKPAMLTKILNERNVDAAHVIYMGNDTNDLACFPLVGYSVAPVDAHPEVLRSADFVTSLPGGRGAVRELCDLILVRLNAAA